MTVIEFANYAMVQQFVFFVFIVIVKREIHIRRHSADPIGQTFSSYTGGLISEHFSFWPRSQKKVQNHSQEHLLFI